MNTATPSSVAGARGRGRLRLISHQIIPQRCPVALPLCKPVIGPEATAVSLGLYIVAPLHNVSGYGIVSVCEEICVFVSISDAQLAAQEREIKVGVRFLRHSCLLIGFRPPFDFP